MLKHKCFPVNFAKFLRNGFSYRTRPVAATVSRGVAIYQNAQVICF